MSSIADENSPTCEWISSAIQHAAHYLPGQGPITVFIHHNTLHALEHLPFEQAVQVGADLFGCRAFLTEERYREEIAKGRIRSIDISEALLESLGDKAEIFVGFLGTRFNLRLAMLRHPLHTVLSNELDWVIAERRAWTRFSDQSHPDERRRIIESTRRWVTRMVSGQSPRDSSQSSGEGVAFHRHWEKLAAELPLDKLPEWTEEVWESCTLRLLWQICLEQVAQYRPPLRPRHWRRHRDVLFHCTGVDSDALVHDVLVRFCSVLLDQGLSHWGLPQRDRGVWAAFVGIYGSARGGAERWLQPLRRELVRIQRAHVSPLAVIRESLCELGVTSAETEKFITQSLLALRGFAGMIWQMECRADRVAHGLPTGALIEFLAVRLLLDRLALQYIARRELGWRRPLSELRHELERQCGPQTDDVRCEAFAVFQLAQSLGWRPESLCTLNTANWRKLLDELRSFSEVERLHVYHLAYERKFRHQCLDALGRHGLDNATGKASVKNGGDTSRSTSFDVITCIDEREESYRRHLEEIEPRCRTWGTAGFFGVAMYYRGADSFQYVPLCPIVMEPRHYVQEQVVAEQALEGQRRSWLRRVVGAGLHGLHAGSRQLFSGAITSVLGTFAAVPLVARVLFPRWAGRVREHVDELYATPERTRLHLERRAAEPGPDERQIGYSLDEMTAIVERLLRDIGLIRNFSRLLIVLGHGSTSLNNPHESAHDCGACGGGRGGPNARAWAQMANDPRVRARLATAGIHLPDSTHVVGGYHNTCDDSVTLYDLEQVPASHTDDLRRAHHVLEEACVRNAHERCRRFESADLKLDQRGAWRHVAARVEDLSQVRPEYGHATNALCIVGRREFTRGLYLDRRAFLQSYDPTQDDREHTILARILAAVVPVCAGINLEYYFSYIDPEGYGCGTKLPHNITSLVGVMNGAASDLRPGLPWQMVEIHEPVRLLMVVETTPEALLSIMDRNPSIDRLVRGNWIQLATWDVRTGILRRFHQGEFVPHHPDTRSLPSARSSLEWYRGWRGDLDFAQIVSAREPALPVAG